MNNIFSVRTTNRLIDNENNRWLQPYCGVSSLTGNSVSLSVGVHAPDSVFKHTVKMCNVIRVKYVFWQLSHHFISKRQNRNTNEQKYLNLVCFHGLLYKAKTENFFIFCVKHKINNCMAQTTINNLPYIIHIKQQ